MADRPWPEANTGRGPINERWLARHLSPFGINAVILGLIFLFIEPNPDDPLNHEAAALMRTNETAFKDKVKKSLKGGVVDGIHFPKLV